MLSAALEDALHPQWSYAAGLRAARSALSNYAELLYLYRSKSLTLKKRAWNRADAEARAAGGQGPEMPEWELFAFEVHPGAGELEREVRRTLCHVYRAAAVRLLPGLS